MLFAIHPTSNETIAFATELPDEPILWIVYINILLLNLVLKK